MLFTCHCPNAPSSLSLSLSLSLFLSLPLPLSLYFSVSAVYGFFSNIMFPSFPPFSLETAGIISFPSILSDVFCETNVDFPLILNSWCSRSSNSISFTSQNSVCKFLFVFQIRKSFFKFKCSLEFLASVKAGDMYAQSYSAFFTDINCERKGITWVHLTIHKKTDRNQNNITLLMTCLPDSHHPPHFLF